MISPRIGLLAFLGLSPWNGTFANEFGKLPEVRQITAGEPEDVTAFIEPMVECNHWAGEEPYDKERAAQIKIAVERAQCDRLNSDEQALKISTWGRSRSSTPSKRPSNQRCELPRREASMVKRIEAGKAHQLFEPGMPKSFLRLRVRDNRDRTASRTTIAPPFAHGGYLKFRPRCSHKSFGSPARYKLRAHAFHSKCSCSSLDAE